MKNIIINEGNYEGDKMTISKGSKNIFFNVLTDNTGTCFKLTRKEMEEFLK